jgi:lipoprotein-anchoring transpeptidase ErfK/SrfK
MTFQKVERLPVTGRWTRLERVRVSRPTAWRLRYRTAGLGVEIDITRQVLVLSRAGVVLRIVDVSSGSERPYYQDGVRNIAHTPRGRFAITRKIDGIRVSKLGVLYRPAYWFQGYAVHGSGSVPSRPASHGCVRVTNPVMDRLYPLLVRGVPVSVYDE